MAVLTPRAAASIEPELFFENAAADDVLSALSQECHDAGMTVQPIGEQIIVCSAALSGEERLDGAPVINVHDGHIRHKIRFALAARAGGVRVWAHPWIEVEEPGGRLLEEDIRSTEYLSRVQEVLARLRAALATDADADVRPPWAAHYDTQDEWRLDAHLRAVAHCDRTLGELTPQRLEHQLDAADFRPFGQTLRDRCEELYEEIFRWGLARGIGEPTVQDYAQHRASLPPEERACRGRLALAVSCR